VYYRILWKAFTEYPMMGLPLFFVFASKDQAAVDNAVESLMREGQDWKEVNVQDINPSYRYTDDLPFLQKQLVHLLLVASLPLFFLMFLFTRYFAKTARSVYTQPGLKGILFASGLLYGITTAVILSHCSRFFEVGVPFGAIVLLGTMLLGSIPAYIIVTGTSNKRHGPLVYGALAVFMGSMAASIFLESPLLIVAAAFTTALSCSIFLVTANKVLGKAPRELAYGLEVLGMIWGFYLFQWIVCFGGYKKTALLTAAVAAILAPAIAFKGKKYPSNEAMADENGV